MTRPHDRTSEPRWPTERPPIPEDGAQLVIAAAGDPAALAAAAAWRAEGLAAGRTVTDVGGGLGVAAGDSASRVDGEALRVAERLATVLVDATAATRLLLAGSEALLGRATAVALRAGLRPDEIRAVRTTDGPRLVRCTHCRTLTATAAEVGERTACGGCGVPLEVFHHYSPRIGAYMGFHADAEELERDAGDARPTGIAA